MCEVVRNIALYFGYNSFHACPGGGEGRAAGRRSTDAGIVIVCAAGARAPTALQPKLGIDFQ